MNIIGALIAGMIGTAAMTGFIWLSPAALGMFKIDIAAYVGTVFTADLRRAHTSLWLMLGECQSKCEHIAKVPLRPATAEMLYRLYVAKGALATTAIEGNTLSEEEVLQHLEAGSSCLPRVNTSPGR